MYIDINSNKEKKNASVSNDSGKKVFIETYGCQMNVNDSEIVGGILSSSNYSVTTDINKSEVILLNTCSVRDNAEQKIFKRLQHLKQYKKANNKLVVGIIGCMAERLRGKLIGKQDLVSIVVGPDEYRSIPSLLDQALEGEQGIAVKLSRVETYDDIIPLRTEGINAWISIMRGCDKFCSFCVVPFTRGRERSKDMSIILKEAQELRDSGIHEITLLGQNVNSYSDLVNHADFSILLKKVAVAVPEVRIRYTTSHPYDMTDELIEVMAEHDNICKYIHLPVQSGSDRVLELMNRHYSVEHYMKRIAKIREYMPDIALSTDIITGFPTETEEDHQLTLELMRQVKYAGAYMFAYSPRENTKSWKMDDDVTPEIKQRRLTEIIEQQNKISHELNQNEIGKVHEILVEGRSKKNKDDWQGRTDTNKVVVYPYMGEIIGQKVKVKIESATSATLIGKHSK